MTSCTGSARWILGDFEIVSWDETCLRRRRLTFTCSRRPLWRVPHMLGAGGRWKSQYRKIVPLSPYVEEPLNSKVIKSFVPEQRSCQVFFVFQDSYVLSLWTFDVHFTHSHIMAMVHYQEKSERPQIADSKVMLWAKYNNKTWMVWFGFMAYQPL